ncbi:hypothetical protein [Flectobacillus major]|uniref:hypothetical protein n=1 Tax=Flectobacillus major TaxID=103 RepID=UPI000420ECC7|nr:hypothetical protein [Flectobacillus major]
MKKIRVDFWEGKIPTTFEECSFLQKELALTAKHYLNNTEVSLDTYNSIRKDIAKVLTRMPTKVFERLNTEQRLAVYRSCDWVKHIEVIAKPFQYFVIDNVHYFLPAERFADTSAIEYAMSLLHYAQFSNQGQTDAAFQLVATLCRPQRKDLNLFRHSTLWNGDYREEYNTILANERAAVFKEKLSFGVVAGIQEYYSNMLKGYMERYASLFEEAENMQPLFPSGEGCIAMLEDVAETGLYGSFNEVCATPIETIYMYLKHKKVKAEKEEEDFLKSQEEWKLKL